MFRSVIRSTSSRPAPQRCWRPRMSKDSDKPKPKSKCLSFERERKRTMFKRSWFFVAALAVAHSLGVTLPAGTVIIKPGDILIADPQALGGAIFHVDPLTGVQTTVTTNGAFASGIVVSTTGDIFAIGGGSVLRVDPLTGVQTTVSSGTGGFEIDIAPDGDLIVVVNTGFGCGAGGCVKRVDPLSGARTVVSAGGFFIEPVGLDIAVNGDIFVGLSGFPNPCLLMQCLEFNDKHGLRSHC